MSDETANLKTDNFKTIQYAISNRVATISLNRPEVMNAISQPMRKELLDAIKLSEQNDDVQIVVVNALGRAFCSGTDLSEGLSGFETAEDQLIAEYKPVFMAIEQSSKLYISSVHGACAGIGGALAFVCDLAIMADTAYLYLAFAGIGLVPDGGLSYHLVNALGYRKAMALFVEAGKLSAEECETYGLANKVVAEEELAEQTQAWAEALATRAPLAQELGKKIMRSVHNSTIDEVINVESASQTRCASSEFTNNAVLAFLEKKNS